MNKKNFILGIILIILIVLAYIYQGPLQEWRAKTNKPINFLSKVNIEEIDKIKVTKDGQETIFIKEEGGWKISGTNDFYLKESLVSDMIGILKEFKGADLGLVSAKEDKKIEFSTDLENSTKVELAKGDENLAEFNIGRLASDFVSTYIAQENSSRTYSVPVNLSLFTRNDWYDKTIFSSDKEKVTKVRFQYPDQQFAIENMVAEGTEDTEAWEGVTPYKFKVNKEKIQDILNIMTNLNASKIPEQIFEGTGLEKHNIIIQVTGENIDNTIIVGDQNEEGLYYALRIGSDNIYLITEEQRNKLDVEIRDLN